MAIDAERAMELDETAEQLFEYTKKAMKPFTRIDRRKEFEKLARDTAPTAADVKSAEHNAALFASNLRSAAKQRLPCTESPDNAGIVMTSHRALQHLSPDRNLNLNVMSWQLQANRYFDVPHGYLIAHPTGSGKSLTALFVAQAFYAKLSAEERSRATLYFIVPATLIGQWAQETIVQYIAYFSALVGPNAPRIRIMSHHSFVDDTKIVPSAAFNKSLDIAIIDEAHKSFRYSSSSSSSSMAKGAVLCAAQLARTYPMTATVVDNSFAESATMLGMALRLTWPQIEIAARLLTNWEADCVNSLGDARTRGFVTNMWRCTVSVAEGFRPIEAGFPRLRLHLPIFCPLSETEMNQYYERKEAANKALIAKQKKAAKEAAESAKSKKPTPVRKNAYDFENAGRYTGNQSDSKGAALIESLKAHRRYIAVRGATTGFLTPMKVVIYCKLVERGVGNIMLALLAHNEADPANSFSFNSMGVQLKEKSKTDTRAVYAEDELISKRTGKLMKIVNSSFDSRQIDEVRDKFNERNDEIEVLIISEKTASGLDLQGCTAVYIYGPDWHNGTIEQAIGRASRLSSHLGWPTECRVVDVVRFISCPPKLSTAASAEDDGTEFDVDYDETTGTQVVRKLEDEERVMGDERLAALSEQKDVISQTFKMIIREAALDKKSNRCLDEKYTQLKPADLARKHGIL
jgi:hypothetical protein